MPIFEGQPQSVIYDPTTGYLTDANGNPIAYESVRLAEFQDIAFDLTVERTVYVSNVPADRSLQGG